MRRIGPILVLLVAAGITAGIAWVFLVGGRGEGRRDREAGELPEPEVVHRPSEKPVRPPGDATRPGSGRAGKVFGQVTDTGGGPVARATVRATIFPGRRRAEAVTNDRGLYELELTTSYCVFDVFAEGFLPLVGVMDGFPSGDHDFYGQGEGPWRQDFVLTAAAALTGRVLDKNLAPVPGARVYVISPEHAVVDRRHIGNLALTDETGHFRFPGIPPGEVDVGVRARSFLPKLRRDVSIPGAGSVDLTLVLDRGRRIVVEVEGGTEGTIVRATDSRLRNREFPGGIVALTDALVGREFDRYPVVSTGRGEDGRYVLAGVGPGPADVEAIDKERLTEPGLGRLLSTTEPLLTLRLLPFGSVRTRVFDATTGAPLEPRVTRTSGGTSGERHLVDRVEGEWVLPIDDRQHTLHFDLDGYEPARLDLPARHEDWAEVFDVPMSPRTDYEGGTLYLVCEPDSPARLAVLGRDAEGRVVWVRHLERTDDRGRWVVGNVPVGVYAVTVLATGMVPVALPRVVVTATFKETHRVALSQGGGLELKVTDSGGAMLEKVQILLQDAAGGQIDLHVITHVSEGRAFLSVNYLPNAATARADSGLASGSYTITAYKPGYEMVAEEFAIAGTEVAEVSIALPRR